MNVEVNDLGDSQESYQVTFERDSKLRASMESRVWSRGTVIARHVLH